MDIVDESVINFDLIEDVLLALEDKKKENPIVNKELQASNGSVLIFLPGIGEIKSLINRLSSGKRFGDKGRYDIIPLHSALSPKEQKRAFKPSAADCRKIIVSTNIAETRCVPMYLFSKLLRGSQFEQHYHS